LKPGDFVLDLLKAQPDSERTILLLRHSKRNSFIGVPDHLRPGVEITPEGVLMAREFGESLLEIVPDRCLFLRHTIARRCRMTAESIGQGYSSGNQFLMEEYPQVLGDPVVDMGRFIGLREQYGWENLIRKWLDREIPDDVLQDPDLFSDNNVKNLLSLCATGDRDLFVVVGHDVTLFPIVSRVFGRKLTTIEFLNGIVISACETTAEIQFANSEFSVRKKLNAGDRSGI
jgi:hypothetical protein